MVRLRAVPIRVHAKIVRIMVQHHHLRQCLQDSRRGRHGGGGVGSPGRTHNAGGGSDSSDSNENPYRRAKRLMRVKHYESMKLPPIPHDAAKCRSSCNQLYSLVCKMAKGDETPVFNWISECNTA